MKAVCTSSIDMDPGDRSRPNASPHPARFGRGLDHETHQAYSRADHPQAQSRMQLIDHGKTVTDVCRVIDVMQLTYHRWRQQ